MNNIKQSSHFDPMRSGSSDILRHLDQLPPYLSQMLINPGGGNDIMNMGMDELDTLKLQNEDRIKAIEQRYFQKKDDIKQVKEICQERAELREHREKKSDGLSYPTYGRGLDPNPNIDTYMINANLCHDANMHKKKKTTGDGPDGSPSKKAKTKRPKIISPSRQKYETNFERYFLGKHLDKKLEEERKQLEEEGAIIDEQQEQPEIHQANEVFDVISKPVGSINKKAVAREKRSAEKFNKKLQKSRRPKQRSLEELEDEVERLLVKEALVLLSQNFIDRMREHFHNMIAEDEQGE